MLFKLIFETIIYPPDWFQALFGLFPLRSIETTYNYYKTVREVVKIPYKNDKNDLFMSEEQL